MAVVLTGVLGVCKDNLTNMGGSAAQQKNTGDMGSRPLTNCANLDTPLSLSLHLCLGQMKSAGYMIAKVSSSSKITSVYIFFSFRI